MRWAAFGAVGALASAVHLAVATAAVEWLNMPPLAANVAGYAGALATSWLGQSRVTFAGATRGARIGLRFVATSLCGFGLNTLGYAALLRWTALDYRVALAIVLAAVALFTWIVLHRWVFPGARTRYA